MSTQPRDPAAKAARGWPLVAGEMFRIALWGVCGALAVVALTMIREAPRVSAAAQQRLDAEIAAENRAYCEKWGMRAGTREHAACTLDLDQIRAGEAKRVAAGGSLL
jgi:hypothetical protein